MEISFKKNLSIIDRIGRILLGLLFLSLIFLFQIPADNLMYPTFIIIGLASIIEGIAGY